VLNWLPEKKMKKTAGKVLFLFILAFSLAGCSEDTTTYYHSAADLRESAKDGFVLPGDSNAQYFLGLKYYEGEEVPQNYSKATYWFQKAAGQGHRYALFKLGEMCENGEGGPKDYRKAAQWFSLAAEHGYGSLAMQHYKRILKLADSAEEFQSLEKKATAGYIFDGDAEAQLKLGLRYYNGENVPQDLGKALEWFTRAANQGHVMAQLNVAVMHFNGKGVSQNLEKAAEWFRKAAENGEPSAQFNLATMLIKGQGVAQNNIEAVGWLIKAGEQGEVNSQLLLGTHFAQGEDYETSAKWYQKAAKQGKAEAQFALGTMYYAGQGVPSDFKEAANWFQKAAEQGNVEACNFLGMMLSKGLIGEKNFEEAAKYYKIAANLGDTNAQFLLGQFYFNGQGVPQDFSKAVNWLDKAAKQNDARAQSLLAKMYRGGEGVPQDLQVALSLFLSASKNGEKDAKHQADAVQKRITWQWYRDFSFYLALCVLIFALLITRLLNHPSKQIWKISRLPRIPGVVIPQDLISSFELFESERWRIKNLTTKNKAILGTVIRIETQLNSIQQNYAKIIVKESHLNAKIQDLETVVSLGSRIAETRRKLDTVTDRIVREQLGKKLALMEQQRKTVKEFSVIIERLGAQRAQLLEELNHIYVRLNALEFVDLQASAALRETVETSLANIDSEIISIEAAITQVLSNNPKV